MVYNLRSRFFPDIQFSQNHIGSYGASFKAQKIMLPSLKCQIFQFLSFSQLSRQQTQFSKLSLGHFLVYMAKYPHAKNFKNPLSRSWGKRITDDGRTDRWTDEPDWFCSNHVFRKGSIMFFGNSRIKLGNNQYKKEEYNQHSFKEFKKFKNNDP